MQTQRQLDDKISRELVKQTRKASQLEKQVKSLEKELIAQRKQNKFQDTMIGVLLVVSIVTLIIL